MHFLFQCFVPGDVLFLYSFMNLELLSIMENDDSVYVLAKETLL